MRERENEIEIENDRQSENENEKGTRGRVWYRVRLSFRGRWVVLRYWVN